MFQCRALIVVFMNGNVVPKLFELVLITFVLLDQVSDFFVSCGTNGFGQQQKLSGKTKMFSKHEDVQK